MADRRASLSVDEAEAAIFDLDGVLTRTARLHAAAWKELFDDFLKRRAEARGESFRPFDADSDYRRYVDGKPRYEGVRSFLESRGVDLPYGDPDDPPDRETVCGLGNRKNALFRARLAEQGAEIFSDAVALLRALRARGTPTAMVSSSRNAGAILQSVGLADLFDVRIDGEEAARLGLKGKPNPDIFVEAARRLGVDPARALVAEDAEAGVEAARAGGFGLVIGVDRGGRGDSLRASGADLVADDLSRLLLGDAAGRPGPEPDPEPSARGALLRADAQAQPPEEGLTASEWALAYVGFDPSREALREALCALGNGYFATRGAGEEAEADDVHYPGVYLAGGYNRLRTDVAGRTVENEDLVNMPNWLCLNFRPEDGEWLNLLAVEILDYRQELDLRRGLLTRDMRVVDRAGRRTRIVSRRIVSMDDPHLAAIEMTLTPENWSGRVEIRTALDGRVVNAGVARYRQLNGKHLNPLATEKLGESGMLLLVETNQSRLRVAQAARTRVLRDGAAVEVERRSVQKDGYIAQELTFDVAQNRSATVEKIVAIHTSRDRAVSAPEIAAAEALGFAGSFADLFDRHALAWAQLWRRGDLELEDGARTQMILRLHIFHLFQTASPHIADLDVGVPARGLHGEAYRGHIFWDELFIFPYLNLRIPEITRALLRYRYRRLPAARRLARAAGFAGAMYPWQSGSSGREESQALHLNPRSGRWLPDNTYLQRHIDAAVAYNVWRYYEATGDREFLNYYGAELLIEIARFWSSLAEWDAELGRYRIRGVMGPDEFHDRYPWAEAPGLDDNAYTNVMAAWTLGRATAAMAAMDRDRCLELRARLDLRDEEIARWDEVRRKLRIAFHGDGIVSQFDGYDRLQELDWDAYRAKYGDIHRLDRILEAEGDSVNRYKASKQADVLMLFYLFSADELYELFDALGYETTPDMIPSNVDYYARRTSHGSTLSRIVHSWVLARSDRPHSWSLLTEALESDVADIQGGTTAEGIHLGAMAGTVDLVQRGQTGLEIRDGRLRLDPCLAEELKRLKLRLRHRGHWLDVEISRERMVVAALDGWEGPGDLTIRDRSYAMAGGEALEFPCRQEDGGWRPIADAGTRRKIG